VALSAFSIAARGKKLAPRFQLRDRARSSDGVTPKRLRNVRLK
jgi:hypothetical protein